VTRADAAIVRPFAFAEYLPTLEAMRRLTAERGPQTADEIWLVEHPPTFTMGLAADPAHLLQPGDIPVIQTERGGEATYHGPGQVVAYLLIDLRRRGLLVRTLVDRIERATIDCLAHYRVPAIRKSGAPGVYLRTPAGEAGAKIAALGFKVSRGCSYHGVALNVAMDLEPFSRIDPCGYPGLEVTDLRSRLGSGADALVVSAVAARFGHALSEALMTPVESIR
jgi:lipoyl(octanoyl) transferase